MSNLKNDEINFSSVRLVDGEGNNKGIFRVSDALKQAQREGLDLVVINEKSDPPVARILDYNKYTFSQKKKLNEISKNNKEIVVKEIRLSYNTALHDIKVKVRKAEEILKDGNQIKLSLRMRGREVSHKDVAYETINNFITLLNPKNYKRSEQDNQIIIIINN